MKCKVDGCENHVRYAAVQLCQKHYFRLRRHGTLELTRKPAKPRISHSEGYVLVHAPGHPLARKNYAYEHRKVVYDIYGENLPPCEVCGADSNWATSHIDHRDNDRSNNSHENLRPLCPTCNAWREMPESHEFNRCMSLTFEGKTDTPYGWSRDPRVKLSGAQIRLRKRSGMSDYDALFSPKMTHFRRDAEKPPEAKRRKFLKE